jgi:hypothetical protein
MAYASSPDHKFRQWSVDATGGQTLLLPAGRPLSLRDSGRLHTRLDTSPISLRHHLSSGTAPMNGLGAAPDYQAPEFKGVKVELLVTSIVFKDDLTIE